MFYRRYARPALWDEMERLRREFDRVYERTTPRVMNAPTYPALNVWTNEDGAVVTAELPGLEPKNLDVSVVGNTLTLNGNLPEQETGEEVRYHRQERGYGNFVRTLELPFSVNAGKVEAKIEKGVLKIFLPRSEEEKPKKIAIKSL